MTTSIYLRVYAWWFLSRGRLHCCIFCCRIKACSQLELGLEGVSQSEQKVQEKSEAARVSSHFYSNPMLMEYSISCTRLSSPKVRSSQYISYYHANFTTVLFSLAGAIIRSVALFDSRQSSSHHGSALNSSANWCTSSPSLRTRKTCTTNPDWCSACCVSVCCLSCLFWNFLTVLTGKILNTNAKSVSPFQLDQIYLVCHWKISWATTEKREGFQGLWGTRFSFCGRQVRWNLAFEWTGFASVTRHARRGPL